MGQAPFVVQMIARYKLPMAVLSCPRKQHFTMIFFTFFAVLVVKTDCARSMRNSEPELNAEIF